MFILLGTGEVYINSDPSQEFSQTFEMTICVSDRRNEVCDNLTISFSMYYYSILQTYNHVVSIFLV